MRAVRPIAVRALDWTGWSARHIDAYGPTWRDVTATNLILRGRGAGMKAPLRQSALTAKFAWGGCEHYRVGGRALSVDDQSWLVIGAGEMYESRIAPGREISTVAAFFDDELVQAVRAERGAADDALLDDDPDPDDTPLLVGRRQLAYDRELADAVAAVASDAGPLALAELLHVTLDKLLDAAAEAARERARLVCVRSATRAEIHRRVSRAYDLLMSSYREPIDLAQLAREAAMAPHHFLRRFKDAFGVTPHRALIRRRLERAQFLLAHSTEPIAAIAHAVGFTSAAAFTARFHRELGRSPRAFRNFGKLAVAVPALASKA